MSARLMTIVFAVVMLTNFTGSAAAQRRLALVIGVDRYEHIPLLRNAENDARSMASTLDRIGFNRVVSRFNLRYDDLNNELRTFANDIREGDIALFFFAGHGYNDGAQDLIMPADIKRFSADQTREIRTQSLSAARVMNILQNKGARYAIVIIDSCRRNPFEQSAGFDGPLRIIITTPLPLPLGVRSETFEIYSAAQHQVALDRLNEDDSVRNSVFTRVFLKHIMMSPKPLEQIAKNTRAEVERLSKQIDPRRLQTPTYFSNITDDFFLSAPSFIEDARVNPIIRDARAQAGAATLQCDRLAAAPNDEQRSANVSGVRNEAVEAVPAIEACEAALRANSGSARLRFQLGRAYKANQEDDKAREAFEEAARQGYASAGTALVEMLYRENADGEQDYSEEAEHYLRQAMSRDARAETYLGLMTIRGQIRPYHPSGSDQAYAIGTRHLRRAFDRGDPEAAFWLGIMSYRGRGGVPRNFRAAETYFRRAADTGHRRAILHLGSLYRDWPEAPNHLAVAKSYWETASRLGSGQATENLALYYEQGAGGVPDRQRACELYEKAAELGNTSSWSKFVSLCPAFARQRRTDLDKSPAIERNATRAWDSVVQ